MPMFQRPWKIWLLFGLCLAFILPAMIWVTLKAIQLEDSRRQVMQQNDAARRDAELQELVSVALWRMDWMLTPLVGQEATRSHLDYQTLAVQPSKVLDPFDHKNWNDNVSPIIDQPSEFVKLHFQVNQEDHWSSPQNPVGVLADAAVANGFTSDRLFLNNARMNELADSFSNRELFTMLPEQMLPGRFLPETGQTAGVQMGRENQSNQSANPDLQSQVATLVPQQQGNFFEPNNLQEQMQILNDDPAAIDAASPFDNSKPTRQPAGKSKRQQSANQLARRQRNSAEFLQRASIGQQVAQSYSIQPQNIPNAAMVDRAREGVSRPVWLNGKLLLARRIANEGETLIQGCWFDWGRIRDSLSAEIQDLLPGAKLVPYQADPDNASERSGRVLATLPIELDVTGVRLDELHVDALNKSNPQFSPIRTSLIVAWSCLLLGTIAVATLLQGVVKLSERRASFVSAVTHELRTPLTTFRMYSEMLAKRMVKSPEQQQQYCETLQLEADRLSHLVENVLQFARLEHGGKAVATEAIMPGELLERFRLRFQDRLQQAGMKLVVDVNDSATDTQFHSDPAAIEHVLFNLIDNACKYAVDDNRPITMSVNATQTNVKFRVRDHGPGIDSAQLKKIFRPFSKSAQAAAESAPGVGLGLALCQRLARQMHGSLVVEKSTPETGSVFLLSLPLRAGNQAG